MMILPLFKFEVKSDDHENDGEGEFSFLLHGGTD